MSPKVLIVGRPNVGKSTFFNAVVGKRLSVVEKEAGITRDIVAHKVSFLNKEFLLEDSGGIVEGGGDIVKKIRERVLEEIKEANLILFFTDCKEGLHPLDLEIARILQPYKEKVLLVVNKVDNERLKENCYEFYSLGFERLFFISSIHKKGIRELLEEVVRRVGVDSVEFEGIRVCFLGKPNVGKSSLINKILGKERVIVSPTAGTTRDAVEIPFQYKDKRFILVDTAGVRRPSRVEFGVEFFSVGRSLKAVELSDVVCLVLDATSPITRQDKRLGGYVQRRYKGLVLVLNKMDLSPYSREELYNLVRRELNFLYYAPVAFTSAKTGEGINELMELIERVYGDYTKTFKTSFINRALERVLKRQRPPKCQRKETKIYFAFQSSSRPPTLILRANYPECFKENYKRFLTKALSEELGINHSPLKIVLEKKV